MFCYHYIFAIFILSYIVPISSLGLEACTMLLWHLIHDMIYIVPKRATILTLTLTLIEFNLSLGLHVQKFSDWCDMHAYTLILAWYWYNNNFYYGNFAVILRLKLWYFPQDYLAKDNVDTMQCTHHWWLLTSYINFDSELFTMSIGEWHY